MIKQEKQKFPGEFISRIKSQGYIDSELLLESLEKPPDPVIRINPFKWRRIPENALPVPWCSYGWYLKQRPSFTLDPLFHAGCYYPQEASGMFTGEVFRQLTSGMENLKVLDLCAAPGGKSTHISSLLGRNGFLVANEVIKPRAKVLADNITRWGIPNTIVTGSDPQAFSKIKGYFDVILVDAPCSGEGMFRDQIAVREWSVHNTMLCTERQKRILLDAWPCLKQGGLLIYSTCTFNPAENEEQVKWLCNSRKAESLTVDVSSFEGIAEIEYNGIKGYGFYPGRIRGEGFFISAIRKLDHEEAVVSLKSKIKPLINLNEDRRKVSEWLKSTPDIILRDNNLLLSVPVPADDFIMLSNYLNIVKRGTELFTEKNRDIIPSHELVLSDLISPDVIPSIDLDIRQAINYLRKDQITTSTIPDGWVIMKYQGINLGLVKNIGSRVNNYFPVGWRVRMSPETGGLKDIITWLH